MNDNSIRKIRQLETHIRESYLSGKLSKKRFIYYELKTDIFVDDDVDDSRVKKLISVFNEEISTGVEISLGGV